MKQLFIFLLAMSACCSQAQRILIKAPGASPTRYQEYLRSRPEIQSWIQHVQRSLEKNRPQEEKLFQVADSLPLDVSNTLQKLKSLQGDSPWTLASLRYLRDLSHQLLEQKISPIQKEELLYFYCKADALLQEGPDLHKCPSQLIELKQLQRKYPVIERVLIESQSFLPESTVGLAPRTTYNWTLLTSVHKPVHFYGTFEQLLNQHLIFENMIDGSCEGFSVQDPDFEASTRGTVFFSDDCVKSLRAQTNSQPWLQENKTWAYTAGAIIVGALVYSASKGKRVDLKKISFQ